jgi:hypothetical protein
MHSKVNKFITLSLEIGGFGNTLGHELKQLQKTIGGSSNNRIQHGGR